MSQLEINRAVRHARRRRTLGADARCDECGSTDVVSLVKATTSPIPATKPTTSTTTPTPTPRTRTKRTRTTAEMAGEPAPCPTGTKVTGRVAQTSAPPRVLCYEHLLLQQGKATVEAHHPLGKANDPSTVGALGNLHRALSDSQQDWPEEVRRNPQRNPLWWIAGILYSLHDYLHWLVDRCRQIGDLLVKAGHWAEQQGGPQWWVAAGIAIP